MRVYLFKNHDKTHEDHPDYIVMQKQRTGADDGSPAYEQVEVGYGYKREGPEETYLDVHINGFNNNKPKTT